MTNFLKIGNSQQNFETEKALGQTGNFDVNAGEVVEVTFSNNTEASGAHRVADPVGAIPIGSQLQGEKAGDLQEALINWTVGPNTITVTALFDGQTTSGTMKFLVF